MLIKQRHTVFYICGICSCSKYLFFTLQKFTLTNKKCQFSNTNINPITQSLKGSIFFGISQCFPNQTLNTWNHSFLQLNIVFDASFLIFCALKCLDIDGHHVKISIFCSFLHFFGQLLST